MATLHEVALLRLAAQRIACPGTASATETVRWLTALQAQDHAGALTSVALRTAAGTREGVEAALDAGEVVKSWPMRGTLHLVMAEDLPWLLRLAAPRVVAGAARRRIQLDLDVSTLERARELAVQALAGGHQLRRAELLATWDRAGLATTGQRGYHMLWHLAQTGTVCFGPLRDGEQLVVLVDEWIPAPRCPEREEALGELARRYFRSHGPATVKDFARWTNLLAADVRAGLAVAQPRLARLEVDGVEHLMDPRTPDLLAACRDQAQGVFLLPGFDEYVLGYQDRRAALPATFADRIVPGGNGVFRSTVLSNGQIVGTWKHTGRGARRTVTASPFTSFAGDVAEAIPRVYAALA
ncbi:MAG: winged helix DNA-binding domain-containing protein [Actinomycetota bacterium]|nr:winged helix DNA-binding domain-containing protein [Actinomycetota bacterium]